MSSQVVLNYAKNEIPSIKKQVGKHKIYFKVIYCLPSSYAICDHYQKIPTKCEVAITQLLR